MSHMGQIRPTRPRRHVRSCPQYLVRPEGANHQWRKIPSGKLSIGPVADERLGRVTGRVGAKATRIVGAEVQVNANIEVLGPASDKLLNALKLAPGEFIRV